MYRVYHFTFYAKRSLGAIYSKYRLVNLKCKLLARPKKPYKSYTSRGRGRGLGGVAPPFIGGKIGGKKGERDGRGNNNSIESVRLVFT